MSTPTFDLTKTQFTSLANSFKNDGQIYTGNLTLSATIPSHSFLTSSTMVTLTSAPQFSILYAFFQDFMDVGQQYHVGSGFNTAQWYTAGINNRFGVVVTAPAGNAGPLDGSIYPVINGNQVTVTALINNPYSSTITYNPITIPFAFIEYTMTN